MASFTTVQDRSLLLLIMDLTPTTWGMRYQRRRMNDSVRAKQNKPGIGPNTLSDTISATLSFLFAFASCHRDNAIVIIGVAGSEVGVLYPRKDVMEVMIGGSVEDEGGCRVDVNELRESFLLGVGELMERSTMKSEMTLKEDANLKSGVNPDATMNVQDENNEGKGSPPKKKFGTAIAAATSLALCLINRFMLASGAAENDDKNNASLLHRKEDAGILSMISSGGIASGSNSVEQRMAQRRARGMLSPRIMILQASEDNAMDYNAFMNCVFCANKNDVVIDGCFITSGVRGQPLTSTFLEQACDRTGGVYSKPTPMSQISGGLTSVLMTLFLPTLAIRRGLNMTKVTKVDFRARCFETGTSLDVGVVCNLCLSIFKDEPKDGFCYTCGAKIVVTGGVSPHADNDDDTPSPKRTKLT